MVALEPPIPFFVINCKSRDVLMLLSAIVTVGTDSSVPNLIRLFFYAEIAEVHSLSLGFRYFSDLSLRTIYFGPGLVILLNGKQ